jgi:hypothetical protein
MKMANEPYDLDTEITKYGGQTCPQVIPVSHRSETAARVVSDPPVASSDPYDLDAEIAKYSGQVQPRRAVQSTTKNPLDALDEVDCSLRPSVEAFANMVGGSIDMVIPRGASDPRMHGALPWSVWQRRRLDRIFAAGRLTALQARRREEDEKAERAAWMERQRVVQHGWAKWMRWRRQSPQMADDYRRQHQDVNGGDEAWLIQFESARGPCAVRSGGKSRKSKNTAE